MHDTQGSLCNIEMMAMQGCLCRRYHLIEYVSCIHGYCFITKEVITRVLSKLSVPVIDPVVQLLHIHEVHPVSYSSACKFCHFCLSLLGLQTKSTNQSNPPICFCIQILCYYNSPETFTNSLVRAFHRWDTGACANKPEVGPFPASNENHGYQHYVRNCCLNIYIYI